MLNGLFVITTGKTTITNLLNRFYDVEDDDIVIYTEIADNKGDVY